MSLTALNIIADSGNFASNAGAAKLVDGCTTDLCSAASPSDGFWVEFDLGDTYNLTQARLFGDSVGSSVSKWWSLDVRSRNASTYTEIFDDKNALGTQWFSQNLNVSARYVKVRVYGVPGNNATQAIEFELYGSAN